MIGSLVHYNCGGSKAVGVVTDMFRYEANCPHRRLSKNCLVISIDWVTKDSKVMPQPVTPSQLFHGEPHPNEKYWPYDWHTKKWYNAHWFKVVSKI